MKQKEDGTIEFQLSLSAFLQYLVLKQDKLKIKARVLSSKTISVLQKKKRA